MALINQGGMYQSEAALNPLPYVNIAMQARARKAAREEAIDKYYQKLPDTINDKGVRDQEIPIINEGKNKIFEFGVKNREALRNPKIDNGASQLELDKMMRDLRGIAMESQNRAKTDLQLGKWRFNKEKEYIFKKPSFMQLHDAHNKSVGEEGSKGIDIASVDIPTKPLDLNQFRKELSGFKYSEGTPKITPHPTDKLSEVVTSNPVFDEKSKKALYDFAATKLHMDDSFAETIKNELAGTGLLPNLVKIAQEQFGVKDPTTMTDEDLAAAFTYSQLPTSQVRTKVQDDKEAWADKKRKEGMEDWRTKNAITFGQSLAKIRLNNQNKKDGLPTEETGYLSDEVAFQYGQPQKVRLNGVERDVNVIYVDDVDPARLDIITGKDLSKKKLGVKPIPIKQADGKIKFGYYQDAGTGDWEGEDGQKISRERVKDDYIKTVSPTKFKVQVGTKGSENTKGSGTPATKTQPTKPTTSNKKQVPGWNN